MICCRPETDGKEEVPEEGDDAYTNARSRSGGCVLAGAAGDAMTLAGEASDTSGTRWPGGQSRPVRADEPASTRTEPTSKAPLN